MRARAIGVVAAFLIEATGLAHAMSTEELIFERSPYVEAARAAGQGDVSTIERLASQGLDVDHLGRETRGPWGADSLTLLTWAAFKGNARGAEALLEVGADPNKATRRGMTPLMLASGLKNDDLFELLLVRFRADPNKVFGRPYETALTLVLKEKRTLGEKRFERAEALLESGANVNVNMDRGETALIKFSMLEDWRVAYWLLEHGADHEARNMVRVTTMCILRDSYRVNTLTAPEAVAYRDKVRDWLLAHSVAHVRIDPLLHPNPKCDD